MGNKESSPPPNGQTNPNRWSHFDIMTNIANARFYLRHDRIKEAVKAYSLVVNSINGNESLAREIYLERANAYIELGSFDEAIGDLRNVVESSSSVSGEKRKDLKFVFNRLLAQIPQDSVPDGLSFDVKPEERPAVASEPEAAEPEEALHSRELEIARVALRPRIQPAGT